MTANSSINIPVSSSVTQTLTGGSAYRPSVPLSVYRELVQELEATQDRVDTLESQNQHLVKQNKQLRQEIEKVVHLSEQLQQVIETMEGKISSPSQTKSQKKTAQPNRVQVQEVFNIPSSSQRTKRARIDIDASPHTVSQSEPDGGINGWVLFLAIFLIVVTSGVAAFWVVGSRLGHNNR